MAQDWHKRLKKRLGDFAVPCMITDRWIQFSSEGSAKLPDGEYITLWIMTRGHDELPRKLCELVVTRDDLQSALDLIERTPT